MIRHNPNRTSVLRLAIGICAALIFLPHAALAEEDHVMLVVDSSGSMWGKVGGEAKIVAAKRIIKQLLGNWDSGNQLGLMAYGHRREADCNDIETLLPVGPYDAKRATKAVENITPKGKTPISESVRRAAAALKYQKQAGTVILITDGLETCNADPCALGKELAKAGLNFRTHVIGFDIAKQDTSALRCLASETGGLYLDAANASELEGALNRTVSNATAARNVLLRAVGADKKPLATPVAWNVYRAEPNGARVGVGLAPEMPLALEPGKYRATAKKGDVEVRHAFAVVKGDNLTEDVMMALAHVALGARLSAGKPQLRKTLSWDLFTRTTDGTKGPQAATEAGSTVRLTVAPGKYVGTVRGEDLTMTFPLELAAGDNGEKIIDLNAGLLKVEAVSAAGSAIKGSATWTLYPAGAKPGAKPVAREVRRSTTFMVPAGNYILRGEFQKERHDTKVAVPLGSETTSRITFDQH